MKRFFTITTLLLAIGFTFGQTPIIITASDMPVPNGSYTLDNVTGFIPNPTPTANFTWDYSTINANSPITISYPAEEIPAFVNAGVDIYSTGFKSLTKGSPALGYYIDAEIDFNANGVEEIGTFVNYQVYGLSSGPNDSIYFPTQGYLWPTSRQIIQFPFTYQDKWSSVSVRYTDFQISVAAAGLNKADATHLFATFRTDTIAGWGKMSVYTPAGPSIYYEVLVDQITEYSLDSFYLGTSPAPGIILGAFNMEQGQKTDARNRLNVYRKGSYQYLFSTFYGANSHGTTPLGEYINTDNLITSTNDPSKGEYSVLLYPNPCKGIDINIKVYGTIAELSDYSIVDIMGRTISSGKIENSLGIMNLQLPQNCVNGTYFVYLNDAKGKTVINEEFIVQH